MQLLLLNEVFLKQKAAILTAREISYQPEMWNLTVSSFFKNISAIEKFLEAAYAEADVIYLTGAGTSAFIGLSLESAFFRNTQIQTRAVATTDIVSHPCDYFNQHQTSLIISFARSGNSPESCAALEFADKFSKKCYHLIITCDANGALANYKSLNSTCTFVLPEEANDKALAMTGSYSGMLLTGLMAAYIHQPSIIRTQTKLIMQAAKNILEKELEKLQKIAALDFKRAMFLGSGNLFGTAIEAALKLQELTDGKIISKEDTYLGLRHGPKAVIDANTLVVYFLSNNEYVKRYEKDLVNAMQDGNNTLFRLAVSEDYRLVNHTDEQISFGIQNEKIDEDFLPVISVIVGQLLGFYKSLQLGLTPDNPSVNGSISRVVQGVTIYPAEAVTSLINNY